MLRIIALLLLLLSSFKYYKFFRFYKLGNILAFILYTVSLFNKDIDVIYNWFNINDISFNFDIYFSQTETLICSVVCLILSILHYSADILYKNDKCINNKLQLLNLFAFSMCFAICSNNMWQFYIGVELLGFISSIFVVIESQISTKTEISIETKCNKYESLLLESTKSQNTVSIMNCENSIITKSATTVYIYNKFASIIFLFGTILYLTNKYQELSVICFTIACLCKSAQIPFSNWLLKATHANTLASILIHCATIIGVGIIFINKFHFLFTQYDYLLNIILIISLCTSIIYSILALFETNVKKIMACLTIASTGIMFSLCALKRYSVSINYFLCHAFFKSLLFLLFAYYIEYFKTKDIKQFKNLKYLNIVGLIAVLSSIGFPPFIGFYSKLIISNTLHDYSSFINFFVELSNCLMDIVIFKLYLQYFKQNKDSINCKFNIKQIYLLIILSIIYGFVFTVFFEYKIGKIYISIIENILVILSSYIIAYNTQCIPFTKKYSINHKAIKYSNIISYINKFNNKIEYFYDNVFYNYQYKLSGSLENINNSKYNNQIKHLLIGLVITCIVLFF